MTRPLRLSTFTISPSLLAFPPERCFGPGVSIHVTVIITLALSLLELLWWPMEIRSTNCSETCYDDSYIRKAQNSVAFPIFLKQGVLMCMCVSVSMSCVFMWTSVHVCMCMSVWGVCEKLEDNLGSILRNAVYSLGVRVFHGLQLAAWPGWLATTPQASLCLCDLPYVAFSCQLWGGQTLVLRLQGKCSANRDTKNSRPLPKGVNTKDLGKGSYET